MSRFSEVLHGGPVDAEEIGRVRAVIMFEEPDLQARLVRFGALLVMASAIATFGLYADSVATVIGAMIVAPLMLPIMGLAFGIAIGDRKAIGTSLLVGVSGMATAIAVGYLISFMMPSVFDPTSNTQIMARTAPRLVDLMAALATGLAGAFAISRSRRLGYAARRRDRHLARAPARQRRHPAGLEPARPGRREPAALRHQLPRHPADRLVRLRHHGLPEGGARGQDAAHQARGHRDRHRDGDGRRRAAGRHELPG